MNPSRHRMVVVALIFLLAIGGWAVDLNTPLGIAGWTWYCIPLLLSFYAGGRTFSFLLAAVFSVLTLSGFYLSPSGVEPDLAFISRLMGIGVFWVVAVLVWQHKRAEVVLRESEERFRGVVENARDAIFTISREGRLTSANSACEAIAGWQHDELIGQPFAPLVHPDDLALATQMFQRTLAGEKTPRTELRVRTRSEEFLALEFLSIRQTENGRVIGILSVGRDITARKQAEEALRQGHNELEKRVAERTAELSQGRRLLRTLIDNLPDGIYAKDAAGRKTMANPSDLKVMGCQTEAEAIGKSDFDFFPKDIAEKFQADDLKVLKDEASINQEEFVLDELGRKIWLWTTKLPLRDPDGKVVGLVGISRNITGQKQAEEALRQSRDELEQQVARRTAALAGANQMLQMVMDTIPVRIFWKSKELVYLGCNRLFAEDAGRKSPAEVLGKSDYDMGWREQAELYRKNDMEVLSSGNAKLGYEEPQTTPDGRLIWLRTSKIPIRDVNNRIVGILGTYEDITGRKQVEAELDKERNLVRTLLDHSPDNIYFKDLQSRFIKCNRTQARFFGVASPEELAGKTDFDFCAEADARSRFEDEQEIIRTGQPVIAKEEREERNGRVTWMSSTKLPLRDSAWKIIGIMGISRDITSRKNAEEAMRRQNEYLTALQETMLDVASQLDLDRLLENILKRAGQLMGTSTGFLDLLEPGDDHLTPKIALGALAEESLKYKNKIGEGLAGKAWQTGQPILIEDYDVWPGRVKSHQKSLIRSIMAAPLMSKSGLVGVLGLAHERESNRMFGPEAIHQLNQFARFATIAIENARLYSTAQHELTQRKQAEKAMRQSREEFKDLFDNAPVGFHEIDAKGRLVRINNTELKMLGYSAEEVLGQFVWKISADEETSRRAALAKLGGEPPPPQGFERRFRRKDGFTFPVLINDRLLKREDGVITGIRAAIQDITESKQAEAALLDSERRYRQLFDLASDAVILVDSETHRYVDVNQATQKLYGYTREEFLQMGPEDVSAEPEKTRGHIAASDAHVPFRWHRKKNGERFAVEITAAQIIHLGRRTALVSLRDVTARLRAEEAVQASETRYRRLFEAAKDGVLILDVKTGKVVDVNPFLVELLGFSHQEFLGKTVWELGFFKDIIANQDKFEELQQQEYVRYENLPLETKDGRRIQVEFISNVYRVNHHKVIQCNIRDVTARQQAEAALRFERDLWQTLLDTSPDHIYFKDTQSRFIKSSKAQARQFGVASPDELVGKTDFDFFTDEHARPAYEDEQEIIRTGVPIIAKEEREVWTDGRVSWTSSTKMPMHDATGKIIGIMGISRDITERKLAEEQLRQLSSAVEHSPASIVITDPAGNIEYVNPKFTEVSGYSLTEVLGKNPRVLKSGETPRAEYQHMWQTIKSGGEWQGEFHNRKKDGGLFWESASISSILDGSGKIAHFVAVKEDITEVKLAREKLRQRESFLSAITENQPGLLWLKDVEGRFLTVNRAFAAACDRSDPEQVHGLTDLDIWPKELGEKYRHDDKRVMATGKACIVEEMIFMENTHVWHETFKTPVRDDQGRVIGTTGYARDITERRRAEEQLTEAFNFNQKIISDAAVGIVVFKASGQCVLANETAAQALGATVSRILEQDFRHIASWRDSGMLQTAKESLAMKEPRQCESHVVTAFGKEVWLVCHFSHFVQNGESHLLLIFNDVTEKKRLEAQFLRSQRMESIGTLAGGIAHDLNNVLTPLLFSVQILKEKVFDDEGQQILDTLETNVRRGASLVKQVLAFGRGVKSDRVLLQVKNIAREIEHIVQETFPKSVQFRLEAATDIWTVSCDPTQIHQVLLNLCVNARDAMPDGGKLSLRLNNIMVDAAHAAMNLDARPGPYVVISVEDTGTGISRENQERIFEPFFTTKDPGKGTGLGLSTTLAIVKSHGGFIHCYSEPGKGSTFKVYLPADDKSAAMESAPTEQLQLPRGNGELVLVVDDEAPIREIARQMLERFGYRVLLAVNGAEAVQLYTSRQNEIAVVITDMAMPVMDGHATIAALQAINPKVKVIGSSGLDMNDGATRAVNDAIRHFIPKPYTAESMLNILDEALRKNPAKRQTGKTKLPPNGPAN